MDDHLQTQHGRSGWARPLLQPLPLLVSREYRLTLPWAAMATNCPVEGYPGRETSHTNLLLHFIHQITEDTIVVLNKGPGPHHRCKQCNMFIPQGAMLARHLGTAMCKRWSEQKRRRLATTNARSAAGMELQARYQLIEKLDTFKYMVRMLSFDGSKWPVVDQNFHRAQRK